ncbi:MAG TPA: CHC2 zinc finger domain-containing protein [Anaerolineales bacterium]|jgi:CHC2-type zinc finger protein|nr:CHC2 zinc finger domain-containing protein [Anaerolineales bacterium]
MAENESRSVFIPNLFERAKEVKFDVVLSELVLLEYLNVVGDEIRGMCPLCRGERCFSANPVKGKYNCFRCKKGGDVIDFVRLYQKVEAKQAAEWLVSLLPPVQNASDEEPEGESTLSESALTPREVRLLRLIVRSMSLYVDETLARCFVSVISPEQIERAAWQVVTREIENDFPDTVLPEE